MSGGRTPKSGRSFRKASPMTQQMGNMGTSQNSQVVDYQGATFRVYHNPQRPGTGTFALVKGSVNGMTPPPGVRMHYDGGGQAPPHKPECFVAGTKITMKNGPDKNIEEVAIGDEVLSYNVKTKQVEPKLVTNIITQTHDLKDGDVTVKVTFDNGTVTHNTIANPFWSKDKGFVAVDDTRCNRVHTWVQKTNFGNEVQSLDISDVLFNLNDDNGELEEVKVTNIEHVMEEGIRTYDITVEDNHTFFANNILTHNSDNGGGGGGDCFNRTSIVELENGESISISNLEIGDKVKTINKNGEVEYSKVYAWFHKSYNAYRTDYINVKTEKTTLTITPEHRIFVNDKDSAASDIKVGDTISGQEVTSVDTVTEYGKYAPATKNGFIVVDGINCSCYAFYSHNFCHAMVNVLLKPLVKLVPSLGSWLGEDGINKFCAPFMKHRVIGRLITKLG